MLPVLLKQAQQQEDKGQADVFDIKPQVAVPQAMTARVVDPIELEAHEAFAAALPEGEADQLRKGQCHGKSAI